MLAPIKIKEILVSNETEDDRINTNLILLDYDWMNYILTTRITTKDLGVLHIAFEYFGTAMSQMIVHQFQIHTNKEEIHVFDFPTNLFKEYIVKYMQKHIESWNETYAFDGADIVIEFYNKIINEFAETESESKNTSEPTIIQSEIKQAKTFRDFYSKNPNMLVCPYA